jgi:hypothetical protein
MLTYADVQKLSGGGVELLRIAAIRMLTYADVCWRMVTYGDVQRLSGGGVELLLLYLAKEEECTSSAGIVY